MNPNDFKIRLDPKLRKPLKIRVAQEETSMSAFVNELIRQALESDSQKQVEQSEQAA